MSKKSRHFTNATERLYQEEILNFSSTYPVLLKRKRTSSSQNYELVDLSLFFETGGKFDPREEKNQTSTAEVDFLEDNNKVQENYDGENGYDDENNFGDHCIFSEISSNLSLFTGNIKIVTWKQIKAGSMLESRN